MSEEQKVSAMSAWQPIESAPRDGTWILAVVGGASERWEHLNGRAFVIRHEGQTRSDIDLGWSVYPGLGGAGDQWFTYWMPLPPAPSSGEQRSGLPGSGANTAEGNPATDAISPPPQPSDATELVEQIVREAKAMRAAVNGESVEGSFHLINWCDKPHRVVYDACALLDQAAEAITQAQARATAAEGEMPSREEIARVIYEAAKPVFEELCEPNENDYLPAADAILALRKPSSAQQTITQLTRELETARKVLEPFVKAGALLEKTISRSNDGGRTWLPLPDREWVSGVLLGDCRKAASFLSSLSHQDEQG